MGARGIEMGSQTCVFLRQTLAMHTWASYEGPVCRRKTHVVRLTLFCVIFTYLSYLCFCAFCFSVLFFTYLSYLYFCAFCFCFVFSLYDRPDITALVDWAWNTMLFTLSTIRHGLVADRSVSLGSSVMHFATAWLWSCYLFWPVVESPMLYLCLDWVFIFWPGNSFRIILELLVRSWSWGDPARLTGRRNPATNYLWFGDVFCTVMTLEGWESQHQVTTCYTASVTFSQSCVELMMMNWCLMSSDVMRHIRDKLWPMPKHGAINLYVHGNQKAR